METLTIDDMDVVPDGLARANQSSTLALESSPDECGDLERVMVCNLLVVENALRSAKDRGWAPKDKTSVAWDEWGR